MQVINVLNKHERDLFLAGHTIQCVGSNPLIAFEGARKPRVAVERDSSRQAPRVGEFPCEYCEKVCTTRQALGGHTASHRRRKDRKLLTHEKA